MKFTLMFDTIEAKDKAKEVVANHGGNIIDGHQNGKYFCIVYLATEKQDAEICNTLVNIGILDENEI